MAHPVRLGRGCWPLVQDLVYLQYHIADLPGWPIIPLFPEASRFISDAIASGGCVLVHWCAPVAGSLAHCSWLGLTTALVVVFFCTQREWGLEERVVCNRTSPARAWALCCGVMYREVTCTRRRI